MSSKTSLFPREAFSRYDENPDSQFYLRPRLTVHLDDRAILALSDFFCQQLAPHSAVLDLMSSYRSHLPDQAVLPLSRVVGLGLNAEEMRQNPRLDTFVVHDLNDTPELPFESASFDAVLCTVSVQYITHPLAVFAEVARVLRPGGPFLVSFSNRCFPSKAVRIWLSTSDAEHDSLVQRYFASTALFEAVQLHHLRPRCWWCDPLAMVVGRRSQTTTHRPAGSVL